MFCLIFSLVPMFTGSLSWQKRLLNTSLRYVYMVKHEANYYQDKLEIRNFSQSFLLFLSNPGNGKLWWMVRGEAWGINTVFVVAYLFLRCLHCWMRFTCCYWKNHCIKFLPNQKRERAARTCFGGIIVGCTHLPCVVIGSFDCLL